MEFSLVAGPFVFVLIGIIEMSLMFSASANLHSAANDAARLIRTGQAQLSAGDPETMFRDELCLRVDTLLDCSRLQYQVTPITTFSNFETFAATYDDDGNLEQQGFDAGGSSDVMLIRVAYRYPLMIPVMANMLSDGPDNTKLLVATVVMQTEPYDVFAEME